MRVWNNKSDIFDWEWMQQFTRHVLNAISEQPGTERGTNVDN